MLKIGVFNKMPGKLPGGPRPLVKPVLIPTGRFFHDTGETSRSLSGRSQPAFRTVSPSQGVWSLINTGRPASKASNIECPKFSPVVGKTKI